MNTRIRWFGALILLILGVLFASRTPPDTRSTLRELLAALPVAVVIVLMAGLHWGGQRAGPVGWLVGLIVAGMLFGLTFDVVWVSQGKALLIALFVLAVLWPALLLYNVVNQTGGIRAIEQALATLIPDRGLLLIVLAWAFSGMLEGLAGFGLPIAIVAPILVGLDVPPVTAVAAVAVGHAWSVTFGDMGVIFQTLTGLVQVDETELAAAAAILLGLAGLGCGLAAAHILGQLRRWRAVVVLALVIGVVQYGLAVTGLVPLAALLAGLAGIVAGMALSQITARRTGEASQRAAHVMNPALWSAAGSYGALTVLMAIIALVDPLTDMLRKIVWKTTFPQVHTLDGIVTPAGAGQVFRPLVHPGAAILLIAVLSYAVFRARGVSAPGSWRPAVIATWRSAFPASIGVIAMVGLSTLMDHTGMTQSLAESLSGLMGSAFPVVSPLVGILGAFATGSNNNSNVLFAPLQERIALLLSLLPSLLLAAQTTGGALGSMIAPAKIMVGCSTVGLRERDGDVLRMTLPYGLAIGVGIGLLALGWSLV